MLLKKKNQMLVIKMKCSKISLNTQIQRKKRTKKKMKNKIAKKSLNKKKNLVALQTTKERPSKDKENNKMMTVQKKMKLIN